MIYAQCNEVDPIRFTDSHAAMGLALMFCATQIYFIEQIDGL